jgi:hypothetical protein
MDLSCEKYFSQARVLHPYLQTCPVSKELLMLSDLTFLNRSHLQTSTSPSRAPTGRLGIHYFPDTLHFREADLQIWLPELSALGIAWIVLETEIDRAIPESFITGLIKAHIQPILRFRLDTGQIPIDAELQTLFEVYSRWGVREVVLFDRPNDRKAWPAAAWAQQDLVDRFLDKFIPHANLAMASGLTPLYPPLEPGGSYWDTAFLRSSLTSLLRRKQDQLLSKLGIAAYAWTFNRPLDWGAGGPDRWPRTRPYFTPENSQDQRGFRIFDWYRSIIQNTLRTNLPIYLLETGRQTVSDPLASHDSPFDAATIQLNIAKLLNGEEVRISETAEEPLAPIPMDVVCGAMWLLSTSSALPVESQAWYTPDGKALPAAESLKVWRARAKIAQLGANRIRHYLLLPTYEWGIDEVHLEVIRPFLRKHRPVVGFSIDEAMLAEAVTVIGDETVYPEDALNRLRQAGCKVERIQGDGTTIASLLAER